ncbi:MAG: nucleotide exchange factor GrpE [Prevotella sp.]|nr:nucleotide exchange factor GrpE [Prevotella sp.]
MNTVDNEKTENVDVEVNDTNEVEASENQEPKDEQQQETAENAETAETEQQDPLEAAKAEIEELKKQALYKQAEFENFRKRTLKEKADLILAGGEKAITAILPVLDDFERALADKSDDANAIREGMELIFQKFQKTLESLGVKKIETDGADFNVDYHESIALVPGMGEDKKGKVIDCVQTGYTLNDKGIRFAKVAVGQ